MRLLNSDFERQRLTRRDTANRTSLSNEVHYQMNFIIKWSTASGLVCITLNTKTCLGPECLSCSPLLKWHAPWNLLRFLIPDRITKVQGEYKNLNPYNKHKKNKHLKQGWRDGSTAKSTDCSGRGSKLHPQHPHRGNSQPPVIDSKGIWYLQSPQTPVLTCAFPHRDTTPTHKQTHRVKNKSLKQSKLTEFFVVISWVKISVGQGTARFMLWSQITSKSWQHGSAKVFVCLFVCCAPIWLFSRGLCSPKSL